MTTEDYLAVARDFMIPCNERIGSRDKPGQWQQVQAQRRRPRGETTLLEFPDRLLILCMEGIAAVAGPHQPHAQARELGHLDLAALAAH